MYKRILVPTDGSELSDKAIEEAAKLAKELGSELVLFYAVPYHPPPLMEGVSVVNRLANEEQAQRALEAEAKQILALAAENVTVAGPAVRQEFKRSQAPYEAIIEAAKTFACELIVMASHGRRGLSAVLLGSETQKLLTHSKVPVLVVR
jgi:nucleotide-binding universal stress UspA family protein